MALRRLLQQATNGLMLHQLLGGGCGRGGVGESQQIGVRVGKWFVGRGGLEELLRQSLQFQIQFELALGKGSTTVAQRFEADGRWCRVVGGVEV